MTQNDRPSLIFIILGYPYLYVPGVSLRVQYEYEYIQYGSPCKLQLLLVQYCTVLYEYCTVPVL